MAGPDSQSQKARLAWALDRNWQACHLSGAQIEEVAVAARQHGLRLHLDGARLWNASVATGIPERDYAAPFDTISVCFSKGVGAPVGSGLAGSRAVIERARRFRKMFGGGMRQTGIIAAGALFALRHHHARLAEDHANAKALAAGLGSIRGLEVDVAEVETNMVRFRVLTMPAQALVEMLQARGVSVLAVGRDTIRAVTNLMVSAEDIRQAIATANEAMAQDRPVEPQADADTLNPCCAALPPFSPYAFFHLPSLRCGFVVA